MKTSSERIAQHLRYILTITIMPLVSIVSNSFAQATDASYYSVRLIKSDTLRVLRIPTASIDTPLKTDVAELQQTLDKLYENTSQGIYSLTKFHIRESNKILRKIEKRNSEFNISPYQKELEYYSREATVVETKTYTIKPSTSYRTNSSSYRSTSSSYKAIQTGPRGGKYYINKNGNKTYIKKK